MLLTLILNPPPGSKIETAKEFGIDLTLNLENLSLTPTERLMQMQDALASVEEIEHSFKSAQ